MPPRSISTCTISFGLVSIPVKLFTTTESENHISFNLLHGKCGTKLKQQYVCPADSEIVARSDMVKGYEFAKGKYVTFTADELKALEEQGTGTIDIAEFIPAEKIDPVYFSKSYYLGPDKGGDKAYSLLGQAMVATKRVALATYAARGKQYLVMLRPLRNGKDGLVMQQLHYADEVKSFEEIPTGKVEVKEGELVLATQLIEQIANNKFEPERYHDEVRERMQEQIQRKIEGHEITAAPSEAPSGKVVDIMEALKASLNQGQPAQRKAAKKIAEKKGKRTKKAASDEG